MAGSASSIALGSFGAIGYFRELSPAIFLPHKIPQNTLYTGILALYSSITDAGIELSCRVIIVMKY